MDININYYINYTFLVIIININKLFYTFINCLLLIGIILSIVWVYSIIFPTTPANAIEHIKPNNIQSETFQVDGLTMNIFTKEYQGNNYTCIYKNVFSTSFGISCVP